MCGPRFKRDVQAWGFTCDIVQGLLSLGAQCNLIVCATTSTTPILHARHIKEGTHVTAMGADCHGKQELHTSVYSAAGLVVADSKAQCFEFGDIAFVGVVFCSSVHCSQLYCWSVLAGMVLRQVRWRKKTSLNSVTCASAPSCSAKLNMTTASRCSIRLA